MEAVTLESRGHAQRKRDHADSADYSGDRIPIQDRMVTPPVQDRAQHVDGDKEDRCEEAVFFQAVFMCKQKMPEHGNHRRGYHPTDCVVRELHQLIVGEHIDRENKGGKKERAGAEPFAARQGLDHALQGGEEQDHQHIDIQVPQMPLGR